MIHDVIYYLGLILCLGGIVLASYFINRVNSKKKTLVLQDNLKKYGLFGILGSITFLVGFILLNVAFYIDEATIAHLNELQISVKPLHQFLTYFFGIVFVLSLFAFIYNFFLYYYLNEVDMKYRKIFKYIFVISIPLVIVSFILFSEGNAPYLIYPLHNVIHIGEGGIILVREGTSLKGLNIALYAVFILGGALLVLGICDHFAYKYYGEHSLLYTCFLIAFPSGIIGARAWYVILDISDNGANSIYTQDWTKIFDIRSGGLGIMGGAILGIVAGVSVMLVLKYGLKRKPYTKMNYLHVADFIIPTILIAQAIGRWGNFFNNEVNGNLVDINSFAFLPTFIKNQMAFADHGRTMAPIGQIFLPLFFIEFCTNIIGYFVLYYGFGRGFFSKYTIKFINLFSKNDQKIIKHETYHADGSLNGGYLIWYGATRAILEPLRTGSDFYKTSIISSYIMIGGGVLIVIGCILYKALYTDKKIKLDTVNE